MESNKKQVIHKGHLSEPPKRSKSFFPTKKIFLYSLYFRIAMSVLMRRLVSGPKLPSWPLTLEVIMEIVHHSRERIKNFSVKSVKGVKLPLIKQSSVTPSLIGAIPCEWVIHDSAVDSNRIILFLHGGGYCYLSPASHRTITSRLSKYAKARVIAIDYRLAPEHPFPAAVEDATECYEWLISPQGGRYDPKNISVVGDSAGGGLTIALLLNLKNKSIPFPALGVCISPWLDLTCSFKSWEENCKFDLLRKQEALVVAKVYAGSEENLKNPLVSPYYGDLNNLPPLLIQVGGAESLRDDSLNFTVKARSAGVDVTLQVYDHMVHVFQIFGNMVPEGKEAMKSIAKYIEERIPLTHEQTFLPGAKPVQAKL